MTIEKLAEQLEATAMYDRQGDIAMLATYWDHDNVKVLRQAPDACDYHPESMWTSATLEEARRKLC